MPPKNPLKKSVDRKLKRLIESKLMQISLRIDGYLYYNKPILTKDAHALKLEVCSYKRSCKNDERALQVIEKLSRILQGIIDEQNSSSETIENLNTASIVSDENVNKNTNSNTSFCDESDPTIKAVLENVKNLHDESVDNNVNNTSIGNISSESEPVILPTKGKDGPMVVNSIENDKPRQNNNEAIPNLIAEKTHALMSNNNPNDFQNLTNVEENTLEDSKKVNNTNCEIKSSTNNNIETDINATKITLLRAESGFISIFDEFNEYTATIEGSRLEKTINTPASSRENKLKRNERANQTPVSKSTKVKQPRKKKGNAEQSKQINKIHQNETITNKIYTESMDESGRLHSKPRRKNTIDLSWIENIKYVREIQEDEFDPKMNWDDIDFSYN